MDVVTNKDGFFVLSEKKKNLFQNVKSDCFIYAGHRKRKPFPTFWRAQKLFHKVDKISVERKRRRRDQRREEAWQS